VAPLTDKHLAQLKAQLLELRTSLEQDLERSSESARPVDLEEPIGRISRVDALQQQSMAVAQRERVRNRLQAVIAALGRIGSGTYGECLRCGDEIAIRRLQIHPETALCLDCQRGTTG
jgi:DnaK suppressor protein